MKVVYKVLLLGICVGCVSMGIGFYIGSQIDTSHMYKESAIIKK